MLMRNAAARHSVTMAGECWRVRAMPLALKDCGLHHPHAHPPCQDPWISTNVLLIFCLFPLNG